MKVLNICLLLIVTLLMSRPVVAQNNAEPMTFSQFKEQKDLQINNGFYTVYRLGDKYYLEIPMEGMGKEVLITTQVVRGYSAFHFRDFRSCPVFDREKQSSSSGS